MLDVGGVELLGDWATDREDRFNFRGLGRKSGVELFVIGIQGRGIRDGFWRWGFYEGFKVGEETGGI